MWQDAKRNLLEEAKITNLIRNWDRKLRKESAPVEAKIEHIVSWKHELYYL